MGLRFSGPPESSASWDWDAYSRAGCSGVAAPRADVLADREEQEAAHRAALVAVEPYINAHRTEAAVLEEEANIYVPELREAEAETANANQQFVSARQQVEQHGSQAVLDVVRAIEDAVNAVI